MVWKIFKDDIKSVFVNWAALIVIIGVLVLPSLYAWFNIESSWDPYSNTKAISIGVANNDRGAYLNGKHINLGEKVVQSLKKNHALGWEFTSEKEAKSRTEKGEFYACVIIPSDFSKRITSVLTDVPDKPVIQYYVNEKVNAVAPKITSKGASGIVEQVSREFDRTASAALFSVFNDLGNELQRDLPTIQHVKQMIFWLEKELPLIKYTAAIADKDAVKAQQIIQSVSAGLEELSGINQAGENLHQAVTNYLDTVNVSSDLIRPQFKESLNLLSANSAGLGFKYNKMLDPSVSSEEKKGMTQSAKSLTDAQMNQLSGMKNILEQLNGRQDGQNLTPFISRLDAVISNYHKQQQLLEADMESGEPNELKKLEGLNGQKLYSMISDFDTALSPEITKAVTNIKIHADQLRNTFDKQLSSIPEIQDLLRKTNRIAAQSLKDLQRFQKEVPYLETKVKNMANRIREFEKNNDVNQIIALLINDVKKESDFFAQPVLLEEHKMFPIPNYGSAMTPFYTTLSLWVGGLLLVSILAVDAEVPGVKQYQLYAGRFVTFWMLGLVQSLIVTSGNILFLHVYASDPWLFIWSGMIISSVFVLIVYTLVSLSGNIGKALSVILLVLQISGSGGTFPIQVTPVFFQKINPYLPFTYAIGLMREAVGGIVWRTVFMDCAILILIFFMFAAAGALLKRPLQKMGQSFKRKLKKSRLIEH
ncbi:putative membrane protein [Bacillus sp. OV322]|uniref:YhgE/Pip domain-containing protein n=1 Tax=Bacillus sp. OV322 TaxID=1882764 RepID=UPI0008E41285|nr:YhgE/Pip domain-containing protein [Bacillus sp. OV322]SFC79203.1 putative membrane protein [Bacillus sp. OV322]